MAMSEERAREWERRDGGDITLKELPTERELLTSILATLERIELNQIEQLKNSPGNNGSQQAGLRRMQR